MSLSKNDKRLPFIVPLSFVAMLEHRRLKQLSNSMPHGIAVARIDYEQARRALDFSKPLPEFVEVPKDTDDPLDYDPKIRIRFFEYSKKELEDWENWTKNAMKPTEQMHGPSTRFPKIKTATKWTCTNAK